MPLGTLENLSRSSFVRTPPHLATRIYENVLSFASLAACSESRKLIAVLDPSAGEGDLLMPLLDLKPQSFLHCSGIEISADRAFIARSRLSALAPTILTNAFEGTRLPARGLSLIIQNPPYFFVSGGKRAEYKFVVKTTDALVDDGILVAILPARGAWERKMVAFWTRWFDDIRIWKFPSKDEGEEEGPFEKYTQIVVVGRKRAQPRDLDETQIKELLGYRWKKNGDGNEDWQGHVAPPTLPTEPISDPYLIPPVSHVPAYELQDASDAMLLEALLGNKEAGEPGNGADLSGEWAAATTWQDDASLERPVMPYTGVAHVAAEIMTGMLGGEVIELGGHAYLLSAFVGSEWSKLTIDADTRQNLRDKGVVSASAKQMQDYPVLGVLDLESGQTTYYEGNAVFEFLSPWISVLATYAQQKRPPLYQLDPEEWELQVLSQFGLDKQLPNAAFPGLAPAQMHRVFAMGRSLDEHGLVAIQGEPGTGKTRMAVATAARQAHAWQHRNAPGKKQPAWMQQLRRAWLKNPHALSLLNLEPVYGQRLRNQQGVAQIREDPTTRQIVAYRERKTGRLVLPEEAGPRALPVLVMTPKKVTKEYEKEIRAAWPQAETILVQRYDDVPRFFQRCVESSAPAVIAICSHSQSQPRGNRTWQPAVLPLQKHKQVPVLDPPEDRLAELEPVQDGQERVIGYRDLETGEMLTRTVTTTHFRCPTCFGIVSGIPGRKEETPQETEGGAALLSLDDGEEDESLTVVVDSQTWFEKRPRWCKCDHPQNQERKRRHQKPLRAALWTEAWSETTVKKFPAPSYREWARVMDHLKQRAITQKRSLASLCSSRPALTRSKKGSPTSMVRTQCRIMPVQDRTAPIQVPKTTSASDPQQHDAYDLVTPPADSFGVYEYLIRFFEGCVALSIIDESHNGRAQMSDIARSMHRAMRAAQTHMLTSGTHFGGEIVSFFFYWYRFHPRFWKKLGLSWRQASEAQRRYGVIQLWVKEYESEARKGSGKSDVQVSTVAAPGLSAKLIPYLLELLAFLTVLDVGAFMPKKVEIPEIVSMVDPEVVEKSKEASEIVKGPQRRLADLAQEKQRLFDAVRDGQADRETLVEWTMKEEEARRALEEARAEQERLRKWIEEHNLLGAYLGIVKSLSEDARKQNQTARMAQGTIPRWFAVLPCEKPFELWQTRRSTWGDELSRFRLLKTPQLAWDYLYPMEKRLIELVQKERAEGRRLMLYMDQNEERSMSKRLQWVLQQAGIDSWMLPNQVKPEDRQQAIIDAMSTGLGGKPAVTVAIVPYSRVNEGINLQSVVDTIIWYEMALNLFMLEQASRRAWRLGKREEVRIYYMAYAGTAGHQKMRKLGGQSGAAASFAGEPARGALIEEAGADQTTLARFTEKVETELLTDEEIDPEVLMAADDAQELAEAFQRRANEEQEQLRRGRSWLGATDHLAERLPAFFTGPQRPVWGIQPALSPVELVRTLEAIPSTLAEQEEEEQATREQAPAPLPVQPTVETSTTPLPVPPSAQSKTPPEVAPAKPPKKTASKKKQEEAEKRVEAAAALVFGNVGHILLARQRRKSGKGATKPAVKKPRVQVEVKDIPAMVSEVEELAQLIASQSKKKAVADQGPTLWDFLSAEPEIEAVAEPSVPSATTDPQQLTLFY